MAYSTPRTWVTGEIVLASQMNSDVRDNTSYTRGDTAWTAPTLLNSWVNSGAGEAVAGYRKAGSSVYLRGAVKDGTLGSAILTLPAGYRPTDIVRFACANGTTTMIRVTVESDGDVVASASGVNTYVSLNGIVFFVAGE